MAPWHVSADGSDAFTVLAPYRAPLSMRTGAAPKGAEQAHKSKADTCGQHGLLAPYEAPLSMRAEAASKGAEQAHRSKADACGQLAFRNVFYLI